MKHFFSLDGTKGTCSGCDTSYHGDAVLLLAEVFLLRFLEEVLPSTDGQEDGFGVTAVVQTQVHSALEVSNKQRLADQTVRVCTEGHNRGHRFEIEDNLLEQISQYYSLNYKMRSFVLTTGHWDLEVGNFLWGLTEKVCRRVGS